MITTCINCPMGCTLEVTKQGDQIIVKGNTCKRGEDYGKEEIIAPKRVVTSLVKGGNYLYSVKTNKPVPKESIFDVLKEISVIKAEDREYNIGDTVKSDILSTGADVVVTGKNPVNF